MSLLTICVFTLYMKVYCPLLLIVCNIFFQIIFCRLANLLVSFCCYLISSCQATDLNLLRINVAINKFFLCLEFSQTTCFVLWVTEKFETRNTKSLNNKQHIRVNHQTMVLATPFPFTFLTLDVVSPTQGIKRKLMGDLGWWK